MAGRTTRAARPGPVRTFDLARAVAPQAPALLELYRRFVAEEQRLTELLGPDDPPTFDDFVAWIVERAGRPPRRPKGRRDRSPDAWRRRSLAQRRRRERERVSAGLVTAAA